MEKKQSEGFGTASLILGIFSIFFFLTIFLSLFGLICGILGIIFSVKQKKISQTKIGQAGFITSIIGTILSGLVLLFILLLFIANLSYKLSF